MNAVFIILVLLIAAEWNKKEACKSRHPWQRLENEVHVQNSELEVDGPVHQRPGNQLGIRNRRKNMRKKNAEEQAKRKKKKKKRNKNACKSKTNKRVIHENISYRTTHLLVIGAGAQTVALLKALAEDTDHMECYRITIVEQTSKFGVGPAYDSDVVNPEHLMNVYFLSDISMSSDDDDFAKWVLYYPLLFDLNLEDYKAQVQLPPRREVVGKYLEWKFRQLVDECQAMYDIVLLNNTSADKVTVGDFSFTVTLSDDSSIETLDILLATGHWPYSPFDKDPEGYYKSPWPARDLTDPVTGIPANAHVGIKGSGLSAIDTTMTLSHDHGTFAAKKPHGYDYKPNSDDFLITMYSRSGHLPGVNGIRGTVGIENMEELEDDLEEGLLSLNDIFRAMQKDLAQAMKEEPEKIKGLGKIKDFKEFFKRIDEYLHKEETAIGRLEEDIKRARDSWETGRQLVIQSFFLEVRDFFNEYLAYIEQESAFAFKKVISPNVLKFALLMPLENAEKLRALMEAGCLEMVAVGGNSKVVEGDNNVGVRVLFGDNDIPHRYFVDATGQSGDIKYNPTKLVESLFEKELIDQVMIPFAHDAHVPTDDPRVEMVHTHDEDEDGDAAMSTDAKYAYRSDGIDMDILTMRVIPPDGRDELPGLIYATGPFAYGQYAFAQGLRDALEFGHRAATDIANNRFEKYSAIKLGAV